MRNWVIFGVIIGLLGSLIIYETKITRDFFSETSYIIKTAEEKISNGYAPSDEFYKLKSLCNTRKTEFYIFYSHNILNNFEETLSKLTVASEMDDKKTMYYMIDELKNLNDMFKNYHKLRIGNVF